MRNLITTATFGALGLMATVALAGPTAELKCQAAKNSAAGKYAACRQAAEKGLLSTGDETKYGESIGKCETKFTGAWQKAVDAAAKAMVTCPDAPLAAADYKSVIDSHTANIANALAGGGLIFPDTCGNGTVEADEDCDFGTALTDSCATATAGAQPYGHVTCGAGCVTNTSTCASCEGVGGRSVAGACWFLGTSGGSCAAACASRGFAYDSATSYGASGDGCLALLLAFHGPSPFNQVQGGSPTGTACTFFQPDYAVYNSETTTADASGANLSRVCACLQP